MMKGLTMKNNQYISIDLKDFFKIILYKWWIIFICFVLFVGISGYISYYLLEDEYSAQSTLFIGKENGVIDSINLSTISLNNQLISDYMEIIKSRTLSEEVIKELGIDLTVEQLRSGISVYQVKNSRIFTVSYVSKDPVLAADIVNKISQIIILKADEIIGVKNIQVIDEAIVPNYPIKPNRKRNIIVAGGLGIIIGLLIIMSIEFIDQTFRRQTDVEKILELTILGRIPRYKN